MFIVPKFFKTDKNLSSKSALEANPEAILEFLNTGLQAFLKIVKKDDLENCHIQSLRTNVTLAIGFQAERALRLETMDSLAATLKLEKPYLSDALDQFMEIMHQNLAPAVHVVNRVVIAR